MSGRKTSISILQEEPFWQVVHACSLRQINVEYYNQHRTERQKTNTEIIHILMRGND